VRRNILKSFIRNNAWIVKEGKYQHVNISLLFMHAFFFSLLHTHPIASVAAMLWQNSIFVWTTHQACTSGTFYNHLFLFSEKPILNTIKWIKLSHFHVF